ncbi:MAG: hypothetical protein JWM86_1005 [Thermoleophilia bacterium]|nr:hypothetical protein [Thermoleophilia bacterium]
MPEVVLCGYWSGWSGVVTMRRTAEFQAVYYLLTGVWAVLGRRSFEAVSGRKHDYWLVRTLGALTAVIGASIWGQSRRDGSPALLAGGSAAAFAVSDTVYVARGRIPLVYLLDAVPQVCFFVAWIRGGVRRDAVHG